MKVEAGKSETPAGLWSLLVSPVAPPHVRNIQSVSWRTRVLGHDRGFPWKHTEAD